MKKALLITAVLLATAPGSCPADTIELRNGRIIHGKVAGEIPASGPITISFTGGGSLTIDAASVRLLRRDTRCDFRRPAAKPENKKPGAAGKKPGAIPPKPEEKKKPPKPESKKPGEAEESAGKKPGSRTRKPEEKKKPPKKEEPAGKGAKPIDPKLEAEILRQVSELSRQRNTNRVRAEAALKRLGPAALPYLEKAAVHPFSLTRRAVVRIAAAAGGEASDKLLRAAREDKDEWVRKIAREALGKRRR